MCAASWSLLAGAADTPNQTVGVFLQHRLTTMKKSSSYAVVFLLAFHGKEQPNKNIRQYIWGTTSNNETKAIVLD
jgi:hypothetical protein